MPKQRDAIILFVLLSLTALLPVGAQPTCPTVKMAVERLPDLNIPRIGHSVFCIGGEVVVAGGHTSGFVPTPTAEYYASGEWHLMPMTYPHDQGTAAITASGEVLLAGGHEKELGIGQTFTVELYDPVAHRFRGYGCLDKKRCFAKALPLDSGHIVISGNWYHDDGIEMFDGSRQTTQVKPVSQHRTQPYLLRTAADNAIVFGDRDIHYERFDTIVIDRLRGEPFTLPLFETWRPFCNQIGHTATCFIGDEAKGEYTNLIQVTRGDSLMAVVKVQGENFSLLSTASPIPMRSQWGRIEWFSYLVADRRAGRAYMVGYGEEKGDHRLYVAAIGYTSSPSPITLYYSEPQDSIGRYQPVLTAEGDLLIAGGLLVNNNNYDAASTVLLLHVGTSEKATQDKHHLWLWVSLTSLLLAAVAILQYRRGRKPLPTTDIVQPSNYERDIATDGNEVLMERICRYMESQKPYLNSNLKVIDVADALNSNRTYISNCIKEMRGQSFTQFVNGYRVEHAKLLLRQGGEMKLSEVWTASGFSSESSFFRVFRIVCGTTPKDWIAGQ